MKIPPWKKRDRRLFVRQLILHSPCPNCGQPGDHWLRDEGHYLCDPCPLPPPGDMTPVTITFHRRNLFIPPSLLASISSLKTDR